MQVFQDLVSHDQGYYIYEHSAGEIGENGWIAPQAFATVYKYFAVLPDLSVIPPTFRVQRLVEQARTNPGLRINLAKQHYQSFLEATICGINDPNYNASSIISLAGQLGPQLGYAYQSFARMESQLMTFGCDLQDVADRGNAIAEITADPEVIAGIRAPDTGIQPPGLSPGGTMGFGLPGFPEGFGRELRF